jgi:hypothetical protein
LLGEIIHALPTVGAFSGKTESALPLLKMPFQFLTQRRPRQPDVASFHFLTAGTHGGNST